MKNVFLLLQTFLVLFLMASCKNTSNERPSGEGCVTEDCPGSVDPQPENVWSAKDYARVFISGHSLVDNPLADYLVDLAQKNGDDIN